MDHYDLVIVGAGSGNSVLAPELEHWRTLIVEPDRFGGTCLNRGCIPSKMFVLTADVAEAVRHAGRHGVRAELLGVDWPAVRDRIWGRIDPIHDSGVAYRRRSGVDVVLAPARFVAPKVLEVDGRRVTADRIVLAAGSRPVVPDWPGLAETPHHTSDTVMRLPELPASMVIVGGGFIASEMAHVFGGLGSRVTIVHRGSALLTTHDHEVRDRFTARYRERFRTELGASVTSVAPRPGGGAVVRYTTGAGVGAEVAGDVLLVAVGRRPNSDRLDPEAGGLALDEHGHVATDATYATSVPGVWALGDLANHFQLKHLANAEARAVRQNLLHPEAPRPAPAPVVPSAVFADPQVASVGLTEDQARAAGRPYLVARRDYADTAYGWALEDTTSFAKVIADPETRLLLGAHILGPQAATLIQPLVQAMALGTPVDRLARDVIYIHPALTEVIENALLDLG